MLKLRKNADNGRIDQLLIEKHEIILINERKVKGLLTKFLFAVKEYIVYKKVNGAEGISKITLSLKKKRIKRLLSSILKKLKIDSLNFDKTGSKKLEKRVINDFIYSLHKISRSYFCDVVFAFESDPAAKSYMEIIATYMGVKALFIHKIANFFYKNQVEIVPRLLSELAHQETGIDIHPGAEIASPCFIDHGTGVVIGESAQIGKEVKIYQNVTLGALSLSKGRALCGKKRHPTLLDGVTAYAGATILGGETVVGKNSIIGGGVFICESIEENSTVILKENNYIIEPK